MGQLGDILACAKRIMHVWMRWEGVLLQVSGDELLVKCRNGIILPQDLINLALACVTVLNVGDIGVSEL
ncbi:hypothetical protein F9C07_2841 [Aspergillus flavus]|uniref:Uncharacterized protein n=1 Tax=Aspergillus flavus (strain ATCC 200026 / FGSC A1120 / IAM 13836 / NRRL 3357 / JCM 12722 / SRRC 167) TaxID=332952 RepID=A0A7U2MEI1_ASPFN|nr:hypothetical protein F9C07_2841 [Aspergillus flavus]